MRMIELVVGVSSTVLTEEVRSPDLVGWVEATKPNILKLPLPNVIMKRHITDPIQLLDRGQTVADLQQALVFLQFAISS